eukprot:254985-Rhodomonas_salina.1
MCIRDSSLPPSLPPSFFEFSPQVPLRVGLVVLARLAFSSQLLGAVFSGRFQLARRKAAAQIQVRCPICEKNAEIGTKGCLHHRALCCLPTPLLRNARYLPTPLLCEAPF